MFVTECIDTAASLTPELRQHMPLVLCVPDSPGWHGDFMEVMRPFVKDGLRAVLVNMPSSVRTKCGVMGPEGFRYVPQDNVFFTNTTPERLDFLSTVEARAGGTRSPVRPPRQRDQCPLRSKQSTKNPNVLMLCW